MTIRHTSSRFLLASLFTFAACGGGGKKTPVEPTPSTTEPAPTETAQTPPVEKEAPAPAPVPPPKFVLGEAKITMKSKSKSGTLDGVVALAADGTLTASVDSTNAKKKKENKKFAGKLTAQGELQDDKGDVIARLGDDGKVEVRQRVLEKVDGKLVKSETVYENIGALDDTGVFTNKKDGKKFSVDEVGKLVGFPAEMQLTITAGPEQRKAAVFILIAMLGASTMTSDVTGSSNATVPVEPIKTK